MEFALLVFGLTRDLALLSSILFPAFGMGLYILRLFHNCILEARNMFGFTGSQLEICLEMNCTLGLTHV